MIAKKSFGQHFLQDTRVIAKIIAAAEIQPGEVVLEIGPGRGVLTEALVEAGAKVVAVEADRDLIPLLKEKFFGKVEVVFSDILKWDPSTSSTLSSSSTFKLVANLPYNVASAIIEMYLRDEPRPSHLVIMVQKEVAERMLAKPGEMSVLSVACQIYATVKRVVNVSPGAFRPMPKVDSAVVRLDVLPNPPKEAEKIIALAKIGFSSRRKQLHHNLSDGKIATREEVKAALKAMGLPETARAQELSVEQWMELWRRL